MKITRIFLDLDDVLNVFTPAALEHVGCIIGPHNPEWGFDIIKAANEMHPFATFSTESFWSGFGRDFWANCKKSPICDWLIERCVNLVGREGVCILTAPTNPDSLAGKLEWIYSNLPKWLHRQFLMGPPKHMCAGPDALLIDDCDENITAFQEAGGQALLVPRPWNRLHHRTTQARGQISRCLRILDWGVKRDE